MRIGERAGVREARARRRRLRCERGRQRRRGRRIGSLPDRIEHERRCRRLHVGDETRVGVEVRQRVAGDDQRQRGQRRQRTSRPVRVDDGGGATQRARQRHERDDDEQHAHRRIEPPRQRQLAGDRARTDGSR